MKAFLVICSLLCFSSTSPFAPFDFHPRAYQIAVHAATPIQKKYGLDLIGPLPESPQDTFDQVKFSFSTNRRITKEEARSILVEFVEEITSAYNMDKKIRPYLKNFPFTVENIDITLFVYVEDQLSYHPDLGVVGTCQDKLYYRTRDPYTKYTTYQTEEEELFAEARETVKMASHDNGLDF